MSKFFLYFVIIFLTRFPENTGHKQNSLRGKIFHHTVEFYQSDSPAHCSDYMIYYPSSNPQLSESRRHFSFRPTFSLDFFLLFISNFS